MARYYGPRRTKKTSSPPSTAEEWFGKIVFGFMVICGILSTGAFVLGTLWVLFTKGIPTAYEAVADWSYDVINIVSEHDWQLTDVVLYAGIVAILVLRYTTLWEAMGLIDAPHKSAEKKESLGAGAK